MLKQAIVVISSLFILSDSMLVEAACAAGKYSNGNRCVSKCPKYHNGSTCVSSCPATTYIDGNRCVASCPKYRKGLTCVSSCPKGTYIYTYNNKGVCNKCPIGKFSSKPDQTRCTTTTCNEFTVDNKIYDFIPTEDRPLTRPNATGVYNCDPSSYFEVVNYETCKFECHKSTP